MKYPIPLNNLISDFLYNAAAPEDITILGEIKGPVDWFLALDKVEGAVIHLKLQEADFWGVPEAKA